MKGDYFVNKDCIGCEACMDIAPDNFGSKNMNAYVKRQPTSAHERSLCADAKEECPVEAIKRKMK
jgi:ferredoxin